MYLPCKYVCIIIVKVNLPKLNRCYYIFSEYFNWIFFWIIKKKIKIYLKFFEIFLHVLLLCYLHIDMLNILIKFHLVHEYWFHC
jgi:hypothetical protein